MQFLVLCWWDFFSHDKVPCFVQFTGICGVYSLTMADLTYQSDVIKLGIRRRGAPGPQAFANQLQRSTPGSTTCSLNLVVIVSNIWRAFCFVLLIQQTFGHSFTFISGWNTEIFNLERPQVLWTLMLKSPVIVLMIRLAQSWNRLRIMPAIFCLTSAVFQKLEFWIVFKASMLRMATSLLLPIFLASTFKCILRPLSWQIPYLGKGVLMHPPSSDFGVL